MSLYIVDIHGDIEGDYEIVRKYEEHDTNTNKIEKISAILKTAKADPTRDEYAEYYLDAIEEVVRWSPI